MIIFLFLFIISVNAEDNALCVTHQYRSNDSYLRGNTFDCINSIKNGSKMFTISSPNELFLVNSDDIYVFGVFKLNENSFDKSQSTVVITTEDVNLTNLKQLKYCHPGGDVTSPPWVTNEFITTILNYQKNFRNILENETLLDYSYYVLNSILGPSCLQNVWSDDENLKKLYPKLFALCPRYKPEYNAFEQSLRCLINGDGDIAITSLEMVHMFEEEMLSRSKEFFSFCKNNTRQKLNNPCLWRTTSWPVLIGNKNNSERLPEIVQPLKYFSPFPNSISLSNYIKGFNENATFYPSNDITFSTKQKKILSWCTLTKEEYEECVLLQKIFSSYDIHIKITSCVKAEADHLDKYECINNINKGISSVTFLHSDQLFTAKRSNLKVAVYANTGQNVIKSILFVNSSIIKSIDDFKNKKGCFSEYGSIDWVSFVSAYKTQILNTPNCTYDVELSKFLGDSCMPGVRDDLRKRKDSVNVEHVCRICEASLDSSTAVNCNANQTVNKYATSHGALECLNDSAGQFAVIKIDTNFKINEGIKVLCKNNTLRDFIDFDKIDDECYLSITPYGGIVTKKELVTDVKLAFSELKRRNSEYGWLPNEYISNVFKHLFPEEFIIDFLDVGTCNEIAPSNLCRHSLELDKMIEEVDTCPNNNKRRTEYPTDVNTSTRHKMTDDDSIITIGKASESSTIQPVTNSPISTKLITIVTLSISLAILLAIVIAVCCIKKYRKKQNTTNTNGHTHRNENENETTNDETFPLNDFSNNRSEH
ncbi:transferrin-like [Onthophagus taurus]|uniref:transferrin-like n=1 Tax=Onthophagus taurus TaxID=166361 RepID=UPI0039BEC318